MIKNLFIVGLFVTLSGCNTLDSFTSTNNSPVKLPIEHAVKQSPALQTCDSITTTVDPEAYLDAWQRVSQQLSLAVPDNRRVRAQKSWYVNHPSYLKRVSKRAEPYLYFIVFLFSMRPSILILLISISTYDSTYYSY